MTEAQALLDVQRRDNTIDQLRFRHENVDERAKLAAIDSELGQLDKMTAATSQERDELRKRQRALEGDAADVEAKAKSLETRLYDGSVTSPKEAAALGDEVASHKARQSELEESSIEVLLELEPLDEQLVQAEAARGELEAKRSDAEGRLTAVLDAIETELSTEQQSRSEAASAVDPTLLETYRKMRITYGPDAVIEFDAGKGGGCPVAMSAVELDRWKHLGQGTLETCNDCGRLVAKLD